MLVHTSRHIQGKPFAAANPKPFKPLAGAGLVFIWVCLVVFGSLAGRLEAYGWILTAPIFLAAITLPIIFWLWLFTGGLPYGSQWRAWTVFAYALVAGTLLSILLEYLLVISAGAILSYFASFNAEVQELITLVRNIVSSQNGLDMESLLTTLAPWLVNPLVVFAILLFAAVAAPLIEESIKPAVLWMIGRRLHSPAEGFALGALCGAGFAMLEGLLSASGGTQVMGFGLTARGAASMMHIATSALLGWGIASFTVEKKAGRLAITWFSAIILHGLWNGSAVLALIGALQMALHNMQFNLLYGLLALGGMVALISILVTLLVVLPWLNRRLRLNQSLTTERRHSDIMPPLPSKE